MSVVRVVVWVGVLLFFCSEAFSQEPIKVACIGNSVTFGAGLKQPLMESYPAILQGLLGNNYQVSNFGHSGATLLRKGHRPYFKTAEFEAALKLKPDIAIISLGLNDTDPRNWPEHRDSFEADYSRMLDTFRKVNPGIRLLVCRMTPIFSGHPRFRSGTRDWYWEIQERILDIAEANSVELIDLHESLSSRPDLFADNLHPDKEGANIISRTVYGAITGNFGGLQLDTYFSDHMVLQRGQPVPLYGKADHGDEIRVELAGKTATARVGKDGHWRVLIPALPAGGPYVLKVGSKQKNIIISDILIGDIWVCSGQSNMAFPLRAALNGAEAVNAANNNNLRFLKMQPLRETDNTEWDTAVLARTNKLHYFSGRWETSAPSTASLFSAVGYYFGAALQQAEHVPIGLIEIAVGGSGIESWIDRQTLEHDEKLVDLLENWRKSDFIMPWVRARADKNLKNATLAGQRHPYEPAYNYDAGIAKLIGSPVIGVIWYQGESNTHNAELYIAEFKALVESWRRRWNYEMPFYYVQLSSLDRPSWPQFRNMQRELQARIPNIAMAVSSDLGDSLDVHPVRKKEIGQRLALLALSKTYRRPVNGSGPVAISAVRQGQNIVLTFNSARELHAAGNANLQGFEFITDKGFSVPAPARIQRRKVYLSVNQNVKVKTVRYAWDPFTRANLVNEASLPASTFSISIH